MGAPFQDSAADHAAAFLEVEAVQEPPIERPPGRRAEVQVPVDLSSLGGSGSAGAQPLIPVAIPAGWAWTVWSLPSFPRRASSTRELEVRAGCAAACRPGRRAPCGGTSRPAPGSGRCSSCRASRNTRPCRPWPPAIEAVACQFGPVAISTASMSLRASSSRKSRYVAQSWLPYLASAIFLTASRRDGLHVGNGHEPHVRLLQEAPQDVGAAAADADAAQDDPLAGGTPRRPCPGRRRG